MEPHVNYDMVNSSKYKKKLEEIAKESIKSERPIKYNTNTKKKPTPKFDSCTPEILLQVA